MVAIDFYPIGELETFSCILMLISGAILLGVVIAQFSSLLENLTSQQRRETEELDLINEVMFQLRLKETTQKRVLKFYEKMKESSYQYKERAFEKLNHSIKELIILFQIDDTLNKISFIHQNNYELVQMIAFSMTVESFQAGDVIIKQDDIGSKFYFIIQGHVEVFIDNEDYEFFNGIEVRKFYDSLGQQKEKSKSFIIKDRSELYKVTEDNTGRFMKTNSPLTLQSKFL